jgi:hypothetical protein
VAFDIFSLPAKTTCAAVEQKVKTKYLLVVPPNIQKSLRSWEYSLYKVEWHSNTGYPRVITVSSAQL